MIPPVRVTSERLRREARRDGRILVVVACVAVLLMGDSHRAAAASAQDCGAFHQECMDARAAGYRDVGICNVERLECPADHAERSRAGRDQDGHDARRKVPSDPDVADD
jgi:hypothetical protein